MNNKLVIVGAGPAGLFAAYNATQYRDKLDILVIDKGKSIENRICPMREGRACINCKPCNITHGFGGAGTFSDCKLSLSPFGVGGDIVDYLGDAKTLDYIHIVDAIFNEFDNNAHKRRVVGEKTEKYKEIEAKLKKQGLDLTYCPTKHLGTDGTFTVMKNLYKYLLEKGVEFKFNEEVTNFIHYSEENTNVVLTNKMTYQADYIIFAPGRSGNFWLSSLMAKHNVKSKSKKYDIGYRVEVPADIIKELTDNLYDMKISYTDPKTKIKVRTFCTNPNGFVSKEKYDDGTMLANGHSYADKKSSNTNFAVLVSFPGDSETGRRIVKDFCKEMGDIVVNNLDYALTGEDMGKFDTPHTLDTCYKKQVTLSTPRDMNHYVLELLERLNKVYPGVFSNKTNLYGMEAKFYSDNIEVKNNLETKIPGVYCAGDGAGQTRGIIQSAVAGYSIVDDIVKHYRRYY